MIFRFIWAHKSATHNPICIIHVTYKDLNVIQVRCEFGYNPIINEASIACTRLPCIGCPNIPEPVTWAQIIRPDWFVKGTKILLYLTFETVQLINEGARVHTSLNQHFCNFKGL